MPGGKRPQHAIMKKTEVEESAKKAVFSPSVPLQDFTGKTSVYFVGMRASGKSTLGREVAKALQLPFIDTDAVITGQTGESIASIVENRGWNFFRRLEAEILAQVAGEQAVVATGGGMVLAPKNRSVMKKTGVVFYLMATTLTLVNRLIKDMTPAMRPPLTEMPLTEEISKIRQERDPFYLEIAHFILHAEHPLEVLVPDVLEKMKLVAMMKNRTRSHV